MRRSGTGVVLTLVDLGGGRTRSPEWPFQYCRLDLVLEGVREFVPATAPHSDVPALRQEGDDNRSRGGVRRQMPANGDVLVCGGHRVRSDVATHVARGTEDDTALALVQREDHGVPTLAHRDDRRPLASGLRRTGVHPLALR
jgi:hypothetical protein